MTDQWLPVFFILFPRPIYDNLHGPFSDYHLFRFSYYWLWICNGVSCYIAIRHEHFVENFNLLICGKQLCAGEIEFSSIRRHNFIVLHGLLRKCAMILMKGTPDIDHLAVSFINGKDYNCKGSTDTSDNDSETIVKIKRMTAAIIMLGMIIIKMAV